MKWQQYIEEHGKLDAAALKAMAKDFGKDRKELARMSIKEIKQFLTK